MAITLVSVSNRFIRRADAHLAAYNDALRIPAVECLPIHAAAKERLILGLHDSWCQFAREYFVVSAFRKPLTAAGLRLARAHGCGTFDLTLQQMRIVNKRPASSNWTPKWHFPNDLISLATRLGLANEPLISGVLGLPQARVLIDMTAVRNFVAHRNRSAIASYFAFVSSARMPLSTPVATLIDDRNFYGNTMYRHWIAVLQYLASTLA